MEQNTRYNSQGYFRNESKTNKKGIPYEMRSNNFVLTKPEFLGVEGSPMAGQCMVGVEGGMMKMLDSPQSYPADLSSYGPVYPGRHNALHSI